MPITLREVASHLNLSPGLVSGVLNNRPGVWASPETRRRILHAARELDYRPHAAARSLRSGKTNTVALVFVTLPPSWMPTGFEGAVEVLAEELGAAGYDLQISVVAGQNQALTRLTDLARARACDAVVLWGQESDVEEQGRLLSDLQMPFVVKGRHEWTHSEWLQVDFDHETMMANVVHHLVGAGHQRIAYLGYGQSEVFAQRLVEGFQVALRAETGQGAAEEFVFSGADDRAQVEACMDIWLSLPPERQPTALAVGAGQPAWLGAELALARRGRRIGDGPGEFAVAGTSQVTTLLFGQGLAFQHLQVSTLAKVMAQDLLLPLLSGVPNPGPVVRLHPVLCPLESLNLLDDSLKFQRDKA